MCQPAPAYADAWALLGWLHLDAARFGLAQEDGAGSEMGQAFSAASYAVDLAPKGVLALTGAGRRDLLPRRLPRG